LENKLKKIHVGSNSWGLGVPVRALHTTGPHAALLSFSLRGSLFYVHPSCHHCKVQYGCYELAYPVSTCQHPNALIDA